MLISGSELAIRDLWFTSQIKVSRTNIFQETKKLRISIISRARIYTKNCPDSAKSYIKNE